MPKLFRSSDRPLPFWWWGGGMLALAVGGAYVYYTMFTGFSAWDDDGYLLLNLRGLLEGRRLYDDVYAQYGPFYYLIHWMLYSAFRHPVTHDAERFIGAAFWLLSATLWARVGYEMTRSQVWAGAVFFLALKLLAFFPSSAGHPEELCMVLLPAAMVLTCGLTKRRTGRRVAMLACVITALALTKINIGLYAAFASGLVLVEASPATRLQRSARFLIRCASLLLPLAVMAPLLGFDWVRIYCFAATVSIAAVVLLGDTEPLAEARSSDQGIVTGRVWWTAAVCSVGCLLVVTVPFFARGSTPGAMLYLTVLQYGRFAHNWYFRAPFHRREFLASCASLVLFAAVRVQRRGFVTRLLPAIKGAIGLSCMVAVAALDPHMAGDFIFRYGVPFVWLLLIDPADARAGRFALCTLSVFVYLYAFPVAGSQASFAALPTGVAGVLLFRDCTISVGKRFPAAVFRRAPAVAVLLISVLLGRELLAARRQYTNGVSLGMPGAERIRVEPQVASIYRWLKSSLDSCPAIYAFPGQSSLYFWTGKESPTRLTISNAIGLLDINQQQTVANDLSRYPEMCIVYNPKLIEFWRRGQDLSRSPIDRYIRSEFTPVAGYGGYFVMKRIHPRL